MRKLLLLCAAGAALLCLRADAASTVYGGMVVSVSDGDTVTLRKRDRTHVVCRLANIDAPETRQSHGFAAWHELHRLTIRRWATIEDTGGDRYGRRICVLTIGEMQVNREMVRAGLAWVYTTYNRDKSLTAIEAEARAAKRELWSEPDAMAPWLWRKLH